MKIAPFLIATAAGLLFAAALAGLAADVAATVAALTQGR